MNWIYMAVLIGKIDIDMVLINKILNAHQNWELVSVDNGIAYFKRPYSEFKRQYSGMKEVTENEAQR